MVNIFKRAGKRILAGFLSVAMAATALPLQSFAEDGIMPIANGDSWTSNWGTGFVPSDGGSVGNGEYKYIDENGDVQTHQETSPDLKVSQLAIENGKDTIYAVCIGCGMEFKSDEPYVERTRTTSDYWNNKMIDTRTLYGGRTVKDYQDLIALALHFGYDGKWVENPETHPKYSKVDGSNMDDWIIATQVLVWEIQQGIRYSSAGKAGSGLGINSGLLHYPLGIDNIGDWLQQRLGGDSHRTDVYNYILSSMESYRTVPSFSQGDDKYSAKTTNLGTVTMKYNSSKGEYIGTIKDTNGTKHAEYFKNLTNSDKIDVSVKSNSDGSTTYTFSCSEAVGKKLYENGTTIKMGKDATPTSEEDVTIFEHVSRSDLQPLIIGSYDAVRYYVKVVAEGQPSGDGAIVKEIELDGKPYTPENKADVLNSLSFEVYSSGSLAANTLVHFASSGVGNYTYSSTGQTRLKLNSNGKAILNDLPPQTYYVKEYSDDEDYSLSGSNPKTLIIKENSSSDETMVTFTNYRETGDGAIVKEISLDGEPYTPDNKKEVLDSLRFKVSTSYSAFDSNLVHFTGSDGTYKYSTSTGNKTELVLNSDGKAILKGLPTGTYYVKEYSLNSAYTLVGANPKTLTITKGSTSSTKIVTFTNSRNTGDGKIKKTLINSIDTLTAAEKTALYNKLSFTIKDSNGKYVHATGSSGSYEFSSMQTNAQNFKLNSSGELKISKIPTGTYTVTEISTADNYTSKNETQTLTITKDAEKEASFENTYNKINLTINKGASDGIISNIKFRVENASGTYNQTFSTNSKGVIEIKGIDPDTYTVTELDHDGYDIKPSNPQTKKCTSGNTAYTFSFDNIEKFGDLKVYKDITNLSEGADKGRLISGLTFTLKGTSTSGKEVNRTAVTNSEGIATFTDVPIGTNYTLTETLTGTYWVKPVKKDNVPIKWNATEEVTIGNKLKWGDVIVQKKITDEGGYADEATDLKLDSGITFRLYGTSDAGIYVDVRATTNDDGIARFNDVFVGTYKLEEVTQKPYFDNWKGATVTVKDKISNPAEVVTIEADNPLEEGYVVVTKLAEDNRAQGLQFRLKGTSLSGIEIDETATVGADGKVHFDNIPIGNNYTISEIHTPIQYVQPQDQKGIEINWDEVTNVTFENDLKKFSVTLTKRDNDSKDGMPHGDAKLAGAVYAIYKNGVEVDRYTTDDNGQFTTKNYVCDERTAGTDVWTIKEITPSEGYLRDTNVYTLDTDPANFTKELNPLVQNVKEPPVYGWFNIFKYMSDTVGIVNPEELKPEEGAIFYVYLASNKEDGDTYLDAYNACEDDERDILTTNAQGYAQTKQLRYGTYIVHQTKAADGKKKYADFEVVIDKHNDTEVPSFSIPIINPPYSAVVRVIKKDSETGKVIPVSGVGFKIKNLDTGEYVVLHVEYPTPYDLDVYYTDALGQVTLPSQLIVGHYQAEEVSAPYGYVLNTTPVPFEVTADEDATTEVDVVIDVEYKDTPQKGTINVSKYGEVFSSVTHVGDIYQPVYAEAALSGAKFNIVAIEDIVTLDGTVRAKEGEVVDTITTGKNGIATSKELYLGKYRVIEIEAPYGMVLNTTPQDVELTYAGQEIPVTLTSTEVTDNRQIAGISLAKTMEQDDVYDIGMNNEITSVQYGLYAAETLTAADGKTIPANGLLEKTQLQADGRYTFKTDVPLGKYYVKEIATNRHYVLSTIAHPVNFDYAGQNVDKVTLDTVEEDNPIGRVPVTIYKIDDEDENPIAGTLFGIFAEDETDFDIKNAKRTGRTGADGTLTFDDVPYGTWIIRELEPSEGFLPNNETYVVEVGRNDNGVVDTEAKSITVKDKWIKGNVVVHKVDKDWSDLALSGGQFTVWKDVNKNGKYEEGTDTLVGNLKDLGSGVYRLDDLRYGKYLLRETKAPTGFQIDNNYYAFAIVEHGVDVPVENHGKIISGEDLGEDFNSTFVDPVIPPEIGTTATVENEKDTFAVGTITVDDVVHYKNLIVGRKYKLRGTLMDKSTGSAFLVNGKEVVSEVEFTPTTANGDVSVHFTFDASGITDKTTLVAFERLSFRDKEYAVHTEITDTEQTVVVHKPEIGTTATVANLNDEKEGFAVGEVTIKDVVNYTDLIVNKEYTVTGTLMDKATGKPLMIGGSPVTASTTFTAKTENGSVIVNFTFDASSIPDTVDLVAYERLYYRGIEITNHLDIDDVSQTVKLRKPEIGTTATSDGTEKETFATSQVVIDDVVKYSELIVGKEYKVTGVLMDKATGKEFLVNGKPVTASTTFTAPKTSGEVKVSFVFDGSGITADKTTLVAFEKLYFGDLELTTHEDLQDGFQTVLVRKANIGTTATSHEEHEDFMEGIVTLKDVIEYHNLIVGKQYTVHGVLMDKSTKAPILVDGKQVTSDKTFTATEENGTVEVTFTFDGKGITQETVDLVVFEYLSYIGKEIATHEDIEDEDQTVKFRRPTISTTALSNGEHEEFKVGLVTIEDVVEYHNLIIGKQYTIKGVLMDKTTGEPLLVNGEEVRAETTFTADRHSGSAILIFKFDSDVLTEETTLVAFETLIYNGRDIATHTDINDADQSVKLKIPEIGTTATSHEEHIDFGVGPVTIKDVVDYHHLIIGREYTMFGVLMDKSTGNPLYVDGQPVTATDTFVADREDGTRVLNFSFNSDALTENTTTVVYERLYWGYKQIAVHTDIDDVDQTVDLMKPELHTTATSNGDHEEFAVGSVKIEDEVFYENLIVGKEYKVQGTLMNKTTGEPFTVDGKELISEATFVAEEFSGSIMITFEFDASEITEDTPLVAYEDIYYGDLELAVHADIDDEDQTVTMKIPEIGTIATSNEEHIDFGVGTVTIEDVVDYHNLIVGREYTMTGVLMDKKTGQPLLIDGQYISNSQKFVAETEDGEIMIPFTFDADCLTENTTVVAFESLVWAEKEIATHNDIDDVEQTVDLVKPEIHTTATSNGDHEEFAVGTITIEDEVYFENLIVGKEYTVKGKLMDKSTGEPLLVDDKEVVAETTFVAEETTGSVTVEFVFDGTGIAPNMATVAFEEVLYKDLVVATHADIDDEDQTVTFKEPKIHTAATVDGEKEQIINSTVMIIDIVDYSGLIAGREYKVTGTLMDKATGEALLINGKPITSEATFVAETTDGAVEVVFVFDTSVLETTTTLVAFESLTWNDLEIATHTDINDVDQTVKLYKPEIKTNATSNGEKDVIAVGEVTIDDVVTYHDLIVGKEYAVKGTLMDKATGEAFLVDGKEITAEATFIPEANDGEVKLSFTFDGSAITKNTELVAFERLYKDDIEIAVHTDINDTDQTVDLHKPEVKTTATANGEKETIAVGTVTIDDVVKYSDLVVGKEYTVKGTLMDKSTGKAFTVNGKEVTSEATFTAETEDGEITLSFTFDANSIAKNTELVAFERLYNDDIEIAVHSDINDTDQTVKLYKPEIGTKATVNGKKEVTAVGTITIDDVVEYHDLIVGKEYTIKGTLMNKATGEAFMVNGKPVIAETTFTAKTTDGEVTVSFTFDASAVTADTKVVAFETLYHNDVEIAVHTDINDEDQTVTLEIPEVPEVPATGVGVDTTAAATAALAAGIAIVMMLKRKRK